MEKKNNYGFLTTISMVIGIVIGSGIFFKADDVLLATGGNVLMGLLGFIFVGIGVLFGALVISQYAIANPDEEGGIIAYSKKAFGPKVAYFISWFMVSVYFPSLILILAFVCSIYILELFGISSEIVQFLVTVIILVAGFASNIFAKKFSGNVQSIAMIIKLIPLIIIGFFGLFFGNPGEAIQASTHLTQHGSFLASLIVIAFTFDGWIVVTSISKEVKNPAKVLPKALAFGVIAIIIIYCLYFLGITSLLPSNDIMALGDEHTFEVANMVFGQFGAKLILIFVIISVYGGVNGMILAYLRLPHALVSNGMMKNIWNIEEVDENIGFSYGNIKFAILLVFIYLIIQSLILKGYLFANLETAFDLSTLPVTFNYIIYIGLYIAVFKVTGKKTPILILLVLVAVITALVVIIGSLQSNGLLYIILSFLAMLTGIPFENKEA